jgi:hypothetical protein
MGRLLDLSATSDRCPAKPLGTPLHSLLPLRNVCHYADGTTTEMVHAVVNPLLFTCLVAVLICVRDDHRDRSPRHTATTALESGSLDGQEVTAHWPRSAAVGPAADGFTSKSKIAVGR